MLASSPLAGLERVSQGGGDRMVTTVRLAEQLGDLEGAPAGSFVVLSRAASAEAVDYRLDMALRWAAIHQVAAVAAFAGGRWRPTLTAMDIAERAGVAMVSIPGGIELTWLLPALIRETGGPADRAPRRFQTIRRRGGLLRFHRGALGHDAEYLGGSLAIVRTKVREG